MAQENPEITLIRSVAKFTINSTRNRLKPEKVCASLCLKTWFSAGLIEEEFMKDDKLVIE